MVSLAASLAYGVIGGTACNFATQLKFLAGYDDALDVSQYIPPPKVDRGLGLTTFSFSQIFASHAIGGIVGNILTALFAQASVAGFDGFTVIPGGWIDHHYIQLGFQVADSLAGLGYSFVMTVSCRHRLFMTHHLANTIYCPSRGADHHFMDHALYTWPGAARNGECRDIGY